MSELEVQLYNKNYTQIISKMSNLNPFLFSFDQKEIDNLKKEKNIIYKQLNIIRSNLWIKNNLLTNSIFCNDIGAHILSFIIDDIIKDSLEKLAINKYYENYYGDFSWLGIRYLWSDEEINIFNKKVNSLEEFEYIKSALKENEECKRRLEETGIYPIRRSYNTRSAELSHYKYHDREGKCSIYDDLYDHEKELSDEISSKIVIMNDKESAGRKIVSFIRRRVLI
jgi:hypothetical protein